MIFDTHAHLNSKKFNKDIEKVVSRANENGVKSIIINGYDVVSSKRAIEIANEFEGIYATVGVHPGDIDSFNDNTINELLELAKDEKVVAIGEVGLDYYYEGYDKELQKKVFKLQLKLAKELDLPVTIHSRDAIDDTYEILKESSNYGVMHCYSSSLEYAKKFVDIGYYISLAGPVTFKNARVAKEVAKGISLDKLLIETDCPYLTPHPHRGERNEPMYVSLVAKEIAELKEISFEEVCNVTYKNACNLFKIGQV